MEPEVECFDPATGKSEGFGELKGGLVVDCSLQLCRKYVPLPLSPCLLLLPSFPPSLLPPLTVLSDDYTAFVDLPL